MKWNTIFPLLFLVCLSLFSKAQFSQTDTLAMGKIQIAFALDGSGNPTYQVLYDKKPVIRPSRLGFKLNVDSLFFTDFMVIGKERKSFDETWQTVWGETK